MVTFVENNRALVEQLPRMDAARMRGYRENLAFYQGQQWPGNSRRRERGLVFNYAKTLVDKAASYLMGGVSFVVDEDDSSEEAKQRARQAEKALRDVYESNGLAQIDFDSEVDASVLGDGIYKVTWDANERRVRVSAPDVQGIRPGGWATTCRASGGWRVATDYRMRRCRCSTPRQAQGTTEPR